MDNLIFALEDLIWWVQDGLNNADMTSREYERTKNCKETVVKHIAELKHNQSIEPVRGKK